jgi:hypothetical protein
MIDMSIQVNTCQDSEHKQCLINMNHLPYLDVTPVTRQSQLHVVTGVTSNVYVFALCWTTFPIWMSLLSQDRASSMLWQQWHPNREGGSKTCKHTYIQYTQIFWQFIRLTVSWMWCLLCQQGNSKMWSPLKSWSTLSTQHLWTDWTNFLIWKCVTCYRAGSVTCHTFVTCFKASSVTHHFLHNHQRTTHTSSTRLTGTSATEPLSLTKIALSHVICPTWH